MANCGQSGPTAVPRLRRKERAVVNRVLRLINEGIDLGWTRPQDFRVAEPDPEIRMNIRVHTQILIQRIAPCAPELLLAGHGRFVCRAMIDRGGFIIGKQDSILDVCWAQVIQDVAEDPGAWQADQITLRVDARVLGRQSIP